MLKIILLVLLLSGCAPGGLLVGDMSKYSPEQMKELKALGYDAIRCATISGGPPISARVTTITIPKDRKAMVKLGADCASQGIELHD